MGQFDNPNVIHLEGVITKGRVNESFNILLIFEVEAY